MKQLKTGKFTGLAFLLGAIVLGALLLGTNSAVAEELTGDEILAHAEAQVGFLAEEGSLIATIRFENLFADGMTTTNLFFGLTKRIEGGPEYSLIYFLEPELVAGTRFLSVRPEPDVDTRMWLYMPALGMTKELIAEVREQRFAGSTLTYDEVGGLDLVGKYNAALIGEETTMVGEQLRSVYVLDLTAKPDADVDHPTMRIWVDKESFLIVRSRGYNEAGILERTLEVLELGEFEERVVVDQMIATDVLDGNSTTITFLERMRPEEELSDSIFDSENLADFDPEAHGL